ncbi:MAG: hypothetical protein D6797_03120 [Bdellovibrio sp.]|nr:MAG: hypothetical protein D6797_03120 [Bdellovibrio sp.]
MLENTSSSLEDLKRESDKINEVTTKISSVLYEQQKASSTSSGASTGDTSSSTEEASSGSDDDVIDADYKES